MSPEQFIAKKGYDPRVIPAGARGPVAPSFFPVVIPPGFAPSDVDKDGEDRAWNKKLCPGQNPEDGFRPRWGGGFFAPRGKHLHAAVDIMAAEGALVLAPSAGTVPRVVHVGGRQQPGAGESKKGGHYFFLVDAHGWEWYGSHLSLPPNVAPGDVVEAGQLLGYVGRSGNASRKYGDGSIRGCPHLHLRLGKQLWRPGVARKYDVRRLIEPLYDAGEWKGSGTKHAQDKDA